MVVACFLLGCKAQQVETTTAGSEGKHPETTIGKLGLKFSFYRVLHSGVSETIILYAGVGLSEGEIDMLLAVPS